MVNINGLPEINGENYPLDIWSLYMQSAVQKYPVEQFDSPGPDLNLEVKTDGRAYVKPPPPPEPPEKTTEESPKSTDRERTRFREYRGPDPKNRDLPGAASSARRPGATSATGAGEPFSVVRVSRAIVGPGRRIERLPEERRVNRS